MVAAGVLQVVAIQAGAAAAALVQLLSGLASEVTTGGRHVIVV